MLYLSNINTSKTTIMKYILALVVVAALLSGCSTSSNLTNNNKSNMITVFTPDGIVYINE